MYNFLGNYATTSFATSAATILGPLYKTACVSWDPQLHAEEFCKEKFHCPRSLTGCS